MNDQDYLEANDAVDLARAESPMSFNFTSFTSPNQISIFHVGNGANPGTKPSEGGADPVYEQFLADVWVGIVLTLMVLSCVCFMCTCLVYHKIQEWKERSLRHRHAATLENGYLDSELPSYTVASGLPTYDEALEQLEKYSQMQKPNSSESYQNCEVSKSPTIKKDCSRGNNIEDKLSGSCKSSNANIFGNCSSNFSSSPSSSHISVKTFFKNSKRISKNTT